MPCIQYCRARQALSIGIWLNLFRKQYSRKKLVRSYKSIFDHFWRVFWGWVKSIYRIVAMVNLQTVKLWIHLWWTKAQLCSRSNSNSVDPHVHAKVGFLVDRLLISWMSCQCHKLIWFTLKRSPEVRVGNAMFLINVVLLIKLDRVMILGECRNGVW